MLKKSLIAATAALTLSAGASAAEDIDIVFVGKNTGNCKGVCYVGFTGFSLLPFVGFAGEVIGLNDLADLLRLQVGVEFVSECIDRQQQGNPRGGIPRAESTDTVLHTSALEVFELLVVEFLRLLFNFAFLSADLFCSFLYGNKHNIHNSNCTYKE